MTNSEEIAATSRLAIINTNNWSYHNSVHTRIQAATSSNSAVVGYCYSCISTDMSSCSSSVVILLSLWQVAMVRPAPLHPGSVEEMLKDFNYSARAFDCNEGDFVDK